MSATKFISWTPHKKTYDLVLLGIVLLYLISFIASHLILYPNTLIPLLIIKSTGTLAMLMLLLILSIGPLARLDNRFLVLLYNRRHLGVSMFMVACIHGVLSIIFYHGFGAENPIYSLFTANTNYGSLSDFPYMTAGFFVLCILFLMAVTSHDFWLHKLSPKVWKGLHMMVYFAFATLVLHLYSGVMQAEHIQAGDCLMASGILWVIGLHIYVGFFSNRLNQFEKACTVSVIEESRAKLVEIKGESIAIYKSEGKLYAVSNYCSHQGGPLSEGKVVDGCITCPWHGFQYQPEDGCSPPPFEEKIKTYPLKIKDGVIYVASEAYPLGSKHEGVEYSDATPKNEADFYIGWSNDFPKGLRGFTKKVAVLLALLFCVFAWVLPYMMEPMKKSEFNFTERFEITGTLVKSPVPMLRTVKQDYLLVDGGKFSALRSINKIESRDNIDLDGRTVKLTTTEMNFDGYSVLELTDLDQSFLEIGDFRQYAPIQARGQYISIQGEIVDPKCFFGAMNPAIGKVHKSCAINCIKGGIPPVLATKDGRYLFIVGHDGEPVNQLLLDMVAEDVNLFGRVANRNNWSYIFLQNDNAIKRLSFRNVLGNDVGDLCLQ